MQKLRAGMIGVACAAAILLPLWFLGASFATKWGLVDWRTGFGVMTFRLGPLLVGGTLLLALIALALALAVKPRWGVKRAAAALVAPLIVAGVAAVLLGPARTAPFVHDVSTDTLDPPVFGPSVAAARAAVDGGNGVEPMDRPLRALPSYAAALASPRVETIADRTVGALVRDGYKSLRPAQIAAPPTEAFQRALAAAEAEGWTIVRSDPAAGVIDATDELFWFGFKDDVAIRVRPHGTGSLVDVRSASRVGLSDAGVNAKRIGRYLERLREA